MGHNPKPIERVVGMWGWWRDPTHCCLLEFRNMYGWGVEVPPEVLYRAPQLCREKGVSAKIAVYLVMEGGF